MAVKISESLITQALRGNIAAICWWEKTRLGYHEHMSVEHEGANPNVHVTVVLPDNHRDPAFAAKLMRQGSQGLLRLRSAGTLAPRTVTDQDEGETD